MCSLNGFEFRGDEGQTNVAITAANGVAAAQGLVQGQPEFWEV